MDSAAAASSAVQKAHNLFQVYLRLRPPQAGAVSTEPFITVEPPASRDSSSTSSTAPTAPTHITLNPPNDRRRAIEKFAFTQVFEEDATQLDVFHCTNVVPLVEGVLAPHGGDGTDALLATLGVSGSGKVWQHETPSPMHMEIRCQNTSNGRDLCWNSLADQTADLFSVVVHAVSHNSRLQNTARPDPTIPRCHLPLYREESCQC